MATAAGEESDSTCVASSTRPAYTPISSPVTRVYAKVRLMIPIVPATLPLPLWQLRA